MSTAERDLPPPVGSAIGPPVIGIQRLCKAFGSESVLQSVNLDVATHEVVSIIGPSGAGKSTLLRCINLLERPTSGRVEVDGDVVFDDGDAISGAALLRIRRRLGMVFQHFNLFPHLTAVENVAVGLIHGLGIDKEDALTRALAMLARVGLEHKTLSFPSSMSGGQQQRVAIARALALQPRALLFDEPTSALDPELAGEVLAVMRELSNEGMTMVVVTHEIAFAAEISSRVIFLDRGAVVEAGSAQDVLVRPRHERTRDFLARFSAGRQPS